MPGPDYRKTAAPMYPEAGENAPPEVQAAIARWEATAPDHLKAQVPLLYWLLGDGTPPYKMSKAASDYRAVSLDANAICGTCVFAYVQITTGRLICSQVRGDVATEAWCRLWRK